MNNTMQDKLLNFSNIILMDGTHGINKYRMDLTFILIKDDRGAGFPVAFMVSNRLDQIIQEVFLGTLKNRVKQNINGQYFMTDDDNKYDNTWINVMENRPKKLLCS